MDLRSRLSRFRELKPPVRPPARPDTPPSVFEESGWETAAYQVLKREQSVDLPIPIPRRLPPALNILVSGIEGWVHGNYNFLPFKNNCIDMVTAIETGIIEEKDSFKLIHDIIDNGYFIIADLFDFSFDISNITSHGFVVVRNIDITLNVLRSIKRASDVWKKLANEGMYSKDNAGSSNSKYYTLLKNQYKRYNIITLQKGPCL